MLSRKPVLHILVITVFSLFGMIAFSPETPQHAPDMQVKKVLVQLRHNACTTQLYEAISLYDYIPAPDAPNDLSLMEGETLEILSNADNWWDAKKSDGAVGTSPPETSMRRRRLQKARCSISSVSWGNGPKREGLTVQSASRHRTCCCRTGHTRRRCIPTQPPQTIRMASPDHPDDLSLMEGEMLEILSSKDDWWRAKRSDGTVGDVPSNFLYNVQAEALKSYTAAPEDPNELSFTKGEVLELIDDGGTWRKAKMADGTVRSVLIRWRKR